MKIATFNIQNLFHRNKDFIKDPIGRCVKNWIQELDFLIRKPGKVSGDQDRIRELSFLLGFEKSRAQPYAIMRKKGGELFFRGCSSSGENKASDITKWNGWIEVQTVPLDPLAIQNKAKVMAEVNADILLLQEVEDRNSLVEFNSKFLPDFNAVPYKDLLVLQGNDGRGQELAVLTKNGYEVQEVRTYMNELDANGNLLFDINFLQMEITTPSKNKFLLLAVHLQRPGINKENSDYLRIQQAAKVAEVYQQLRKNGHEYIVVAGTLNSVSYCFSLASILQHTDLKDVTKHPSFEVVKDKGKDAGYYSMGAYRMGVNIKQKDYLLMSPAMFQKVKGSGLNRKGVWPEKSPQWPVYRSVGNEKQAASEFPIVWGELDF